MIKRNARNAVIVVPPLVIKFPLDGNLSRIFREFALSWKAFLHGLSPPVLLLGPFLLRPSVDTFLKNLPPEKIQSLVPTIEERIKELSSARIEHRELRHPERHIALYRGRIVFIDFDHGRLSSSSRDLNKFRAWASGTLRSLLQHSRER